MSHSLPPPSEEVQRLLEAERNAPAPPDELRVRALARAAAAAGSGGGASASWLVRARPTLLLAAALGLVAVGAIAAYRALATPDDSLPSDPAPALAAAPAPSPRPAATHGEPTPVTAPPAEPATASTDAPKSPTAAAARRPPSDEVHAAELALLQRARAAVARGDDTEALGAIAEHERRFPAGRLREEREALRVKALTRLGRKDEARRAAEGFKREFPRSVLSSSIEQTITPPR